MIKDKIILMVNEWYESITLEEVVFTYTSYTRDLESSKQTESELTGKCSKAGKIKVRTEEYDKCKTEGKFYKCFKEGKDVKHKSARITTKA